MGEEAIERTEMLDELQEGFTKRTFLVIFYGAFVLMPANIYLLLVAGQSLLTPIHFIALILWVEFCKLTRRPLTTAEAFIVYSVSALAAGQMLFYLYAIHPAYFRVSPFTNSREMLAVMADGTTKTFAQLAPKWWAPPKEVVETRSFLHKAWLLPIGIGALVWIFHLMADLSLGIIGRELFIKVEKLEFPFAHPPADACVALTQDRADFRKVFTITGLIGTIWGLLIYWPLVLGKKIVNYPIPWADFNARLHYALPLWTRMQSIWIATTTETTGAAGQIARQVLKIDWMIYAFLAFLGIHIFNIVLRRLKVGINLSLIGLAVGMMAPYSFQRLALSGGRSRQGGFLEVGQGVVQQISLCSGGRAGGGGRVCDRALGGNCRP